MANNPTNANPTPATVSNAGKSPTARTVPPRPSAPGPRPRPNARPKPAPPKYWKEHPEDFLIEGYDEKSDEYLAQAAVLDTVIRTSKLKTALIRNNNLKRGAGISNTELHEYLAKWQRHVIEEEINRRAAEEAKAKDPDKPTSFSSIYRIKEEIRKEYECREAMIFDIKTGAATPLWVTSFEDLPFQGTGKWGVAILDSKTTQNDLKEILAKLALSRWLGIIPEDICALVVTKASKFIFKEQAKLAEVNIPILFDFSGRSQPDKAILDPANGLIAADKGRQGYSYGIKFRGILTKKQAADLGQTLTNRNTTELITAMASKFSANGRNVSSQIVEALTYGHESLPDLPEQDMWRRPGQGNNMPWMFVWADFPNDCMPDVDAAPFKKRLEDVAEIWDTTLKEYNVSLIVADKHIYNGPGRGHEMQKVNWKNTQLLGEVLGIKDKIESFYKGVPAEDLLS